MSYNPLQNYFRQPKIFLSLPSLGKYNKPETFSGDIEKLPIYGMTGMDQIIVKTPDALLNGESTVRLIQSCCPTILNAWEITNLDIDTLLVAIRIATYGNKMNVTSICNECNSENSYDIDISSFLNFYSSCKFESSVIVDNLIIKLKPLTYKESTIYGLENFSLQKQLAQVENLHDDNEKQKVLSSIFSEFALLQNKILVSSIDEIQTPETIVTEYGFIKEWVDNCEQHVIKQIRNVLDTNGKNWKLPSQEASCSTCGSSTSIDIDLDQSSFFDNA